MNHIERDVLQRKLEEIEQLSNLDYIPIVNANIDTLLIMIDSIAKEKINMPESLTWIEPLIVKLCLHCSSFLSLFKGTQIPITNIKLQDVSSIKLLLRAITENYLTSHYLYFDNVDNEEKEFRFLVYKYCGLHQRANVKPPSTISEEHISQEREKLNLLRAKIEMSEHFLKLEKGTKKGILEGKKPRLDLNWVKLSKKSNLNEYIFTMLYSHNSSYAHSEFLSILQLKTGYNSSENGETRDHHLMELANYFICKTIIELSELFPNTKACLDKLDVYTRKIIEIYSQLIQNRPIQ